MKKGRKNGERVVLLVSILDTFGRLLVTFHKQNERVGRVGSRTVFSFLFHGFMDGLTLDPLQPTQSKNADFHLWRRPWMGVVFTSILEHFENIR